MTRRLSTGKARSIALWACAAALALCGCGPTRLTVKPQIPALLMTPMPLSMGVRIPKSFAEYVQKESGEERKWEITLGAGQSEAIRQVTSAMFEHTFVLSDQAPGDAAAIAAHQLDAILETTLDSYVYLLPTSGGADYYSATIGYKVSLLAVDGTVLGSWIYEGYGSAPSRNLGSAKGVELVTGLAIRDACANLAVHLRDQELVKNLLTPAPKGPTTPSAPAPSAAAPAMSGPTPSADTNPTGKSPVADTAPSAGAAPSAMAPSGDSASATTGTAPSAGASPSAGAAPAAKPATAPPATIAPAPSEPATAPTPAAADGQATSGN
jgi:hypothetical protein